ncbi:MAG: ABC transporter ATP-binding protein, partial [Lentisphaeria bacterium]|nr:ABC transporter ATP-binding protein [Lentisphaeria bacterium]
MTEVEIRGVSKRYTEAPILKGVDLDIHAGELFFLLGPSGCGKSTLLRILAGLVEADAGTVRFDGEDILAQPPEKRRTAMVFQNYALWPHLSVFENVAFAPRNLGYPKRRIRETVEQALETVEMAEFAQRKPPSLSGGQQQRVALARALAAEPRLLLLDEPLSNLDARLRDAMRGKIKAICKARNLTALYVTHDRQEALSMADRIAVMHRGVIRRLGTPEEVYNHPGDCFTAKFLGDVNFIPGELGSDGVFRSAVGEFP